MMGLHLSDTSRYGQGTSPKTTLRAAWAGPASASPRMQIDQPAINIEFNMIEPYAHVTAARTNSFLNVVAVAIAVFTGANGPPSKKRRASASQRNW